MTKRLTDEELSEIRERAKIALKAEYSIPYTLAYLAREDVPKLLSEIERLSTELNHAENLLSEAHDVMDDVHLYDTELYEEISKYFYGGDK